MPQPNVRAQVVSGPLQNVSIAYRNRAYISERVFPIIDSPSPEAKIGEYLRGDWFRDEAAIRAASTRAVRGGYKITTQPISTVEYSFAKEVTEEDIKLSALMNTPPLQPVQDAVEFVTDKLQLKRERTMADVILAATWSGVAGEDAAGLWAAGSGNTFIEDVETRIEYIESRTGFKPNVMLLTANTLKELKMEATLLDRIKYTQRGIVSAELIAAVFDLDEVLIAGAIRTTDEETKAGTEFTPARVWEKNATKGSALLFYRPPRPGLKTPSAGYTIRTAYPNAQYRRIRTWNEPAENQDVYECSEMFQIKQTGSDLGFLWNDTILT